VNRLSCMRVHIRLHLSYGGEGASFLCGYGDQWTRRGLWEREYVLCGYRSRGNIIPMYLGVRLEVGRDGILEAPACFSHDGARQVVR
jgi:hypothetical protein